MNNTFEFSAAIFDLDGTLLYTLEEIAAAINAALVRRGCPEHPVSAYRQFVGSGAKKLAWRALPVEKQNEEEFAALYPFVIEEFERLLNTIARPYDGIVDMLETFSAAGKKLAVLSNKPDALTTLVVKEFFPQIDFVAVQGARSDMPLKPEPQSALGVAAAMGIAPEKIIFVGDSDVDINTAHNAGMISVGAGWGFRGGDELVEAGAAVVLSEPAELKNLL